jgi:acyl phosphate:glycerol-3-phosphate acyltransferase
MEAIYPLVLGYLFGSIPFGLLLAKAAGLGDVRKIGSGNIGATNVLRAGSKWIAALTLLLDMAKGLVPVLVARRAWGDNAMILAAIGALVGHIFPIWLRFRGGKGVATYIGALAGLHWPLALLFALVWLLAAFIWRISSLAALLSSAAVAVGSAVLVPGRLTIALFILSAVIFITHRTNIARLLHKQEPRIDFSKKV